MNIYEVMKLADGHHEIGTWKVMWKEVDGSLFIAQVYSFHGPLGKEYRGQFIQLKNDEIIVVHSPDGSAGMQATVNAARNWISGKYDCEGVVK